MIKNKNIKRVFKIAQSEAEDPMLMLKNLISGAISSGLIVESDRQKALSLLNKKDHEWNLSDINELDSILPEEMKLKNLYYEKIKQYIKNNINQNISTNTVQPKLDSAKKNIFKNIKFDNNNIFIEFILSSHYSIINEAANQASIRIKPQSTNSVLLENITQEKYEKFIKFLENKDINVNELANHSFIDEKQLIQNKTRGEIDIKRCDPEKVPNWDFEIKVLNFDSLDIPTRDHIKKAIMSSFAGEITLNKDTDRSFYMINRSPVLLGDTEETSQILKNGYFIRGTPSMYSKLLSIGKMLLTSTGYSRVEAEVKKFANEGLFYDGRLGKRIDPSKVRFDGALDINKKTFESQIRDLAKEYFKGELIYKGFDPRKNPAKFKQADLYDEQIDGIKFLYTRSNALLADETGLGKTVQLLAAGELRRRVDSGEISASYSSLSKEDKINKLNSGKSGVIVTKNAVVGDAIRGLKNMTSKSLSPNMIWSGDQLFEWLGSNGYDKINYAKDEERSRIPSRPPFTWCVLNYEKFSIAPLNIQNAIQKVKDALAKNNAYIDAVVNEIKKLSYSPQTVEDSFKQIAERNRLISPISERYLMIMLEYFKDKNGNFINSKNKAAPKMLEKAIREIQAYAVGIKKKHEINAAKRIKRLQDRELAGPKQKEVSLEISKIKQDIDQIDSAIEQLKSIVDGTINVEKRNEALIKYEQYIIEQEVLLNNLQSLQNEWHELEQLRIRFQDGGKRKILTQYLELMAKNGHLSVMILDEVHSVKNGHPSNRDFEESLDHDENFTTFNVQEVTENVPNVWGASATAVANKAIDLRNQLQAINNPLGYLAHDSFVDSVSVALPGMDGEDGTAQAIKDNLIAEGVMLQRSKSQIWNKEKAKNLIKLIKEGSGIDVKFNTGLMIILALQTYVNINNISSSANLKPQKDEIILKIKQQLKNDKFNQSQVNAIINSMFKFDSNGDIVVDKDGRIVSANEKFNPWHPRQFVTTSPTDYRIYEEYKEDFDRRVQESLAKNPNLLGSPNFGGVLFVHYKHAIAKAKVPYTLNRIKPHLMACKRVGVFTASIYARYLLIDGIKEIIKDLPKDCELYGKSVLSIEGGQDLEIRNEEVSDFKRNPENSKYAAIVIQISAGGTGISLENTASWSIFNDLPISPAEDEQALGRFYRINSTSDVVSEYIVSNDIKEDADYWESLLDRKKVAEQITKLQERQLQLLAMGADFNNSLYRDTMKELGRLHKIRRAAEAKAIKIRRDITEELKSNVRKKSNKTSKNYSWYKIAETYSNFIDYDDIINERF